MELWARDEQGISKVKQGIFLVNFLLIWTCKIEVHNFTCKWQHASELLLQVHEGIAYVLVLICVNISATSTDSY